MLRKLSKIFKLLPLFQRFEPLAQGGVPCLNDCKSMGIVQDLSGSQDAGPHPDRARTNENHATTGYYGFGQRSPSQTTGIPHKAKNIPPLWPKAKCHTRKSASPQPLKYFFQCFSISFLCLSTIFCISPICFGLNPCEFANAITGSNQNFASPSGE